MSRISRSVALFSAGQAAGDELAIEIPDRQAVSFDIEFRMIEHRHRVQRIDVGDQMAAHAIGVDQLDHARFFDGLLAHLVARQNSGLRSTFQRSGA